uniref:hypothetical protein n=1 Tax=Acetatifactor sp. TaxID=1872090 RepID=UPI004056ADDF
MAKIATKRATKQLQKIFDFLGEYGGIIETDTPDTWWNLDVEVEHKDENRKDILIGVYKSIEGDIVFDPQFQLSLKMKSGKILETEIKGCTLFMFFNIGEIDDEDMVYYFGNKEKDVYGLRRRFSSFMDNMVEYAPYLTNPKKVTKYNSTLEGEED